MDRVEDLADPRRCKGSIAEGQCTNRAEHGSEYCKAHGGVSTLAAEERRAYVLTQVEAKRRLAQIQSELEPVRELRDQIAHLHYMIERQFDLATKKNDAEFIAACAPLNMLILSMERLVKTCTTLEANLGSLLAKPTLLSVGQSIITIIVSELSDIPGYEERVDRICHGVTDTIISATNKEKSE